MNNIEFAYNRFCKKRFPLPSEEQIAHLEKQIGVPLPPDYRQFLLEYNGGLFTEPRIMPLVEGCPLDRLTVMDGIGAPDYRFELETYIDLFDDNYPAQILPIGYTMMGNLIFIVTDPEGDDYGEIGLKKAYSDEAFNVGINIEEFFGLLQEPPEET